MQMIELKYYMDLLPECNIFREDGMVELFFHDMETKAYYIAREFANSADESYMAQNAFLDDDTKNYVVKFNQNRLEDIAFMQYLFNSSNNMFSGYAVKRIPIEDFYLGMEITPPARCFGNIEQKTKEPLLGLNKFISEEKVMYHRELLRKIYEWSDEEVNYYSIPRSIPHKDKISLTQTVAVERFLNQNYIPYKMRYEDFPEYSKLKKRDSQFIMKARQKDNQKFYEMLSDFKKKYNDIYHDLVDKGTVSPKWKSEYELFKLIRAFFPDAVFQYRSEWLGNQSIDVFIPSKRIGIEYQGIQHYEAINHFGGIESYENRKKLDSKKKSLCEKNGVILVEWKYDEPINEVVLKIKINSWS
ncbi:hypothetical protein DWX41_20830 [Hungatella hathewayi]|uniref:Uncharacterized protein n=1 Tax=Hungatella hathewayi TaxID=154046 RepID=A0A3E2WEY4_9FIRM|nr:MULTISPECIES: hypothetical protein [Clostridia]MBS6765560.1 hypothetical protein [Clostridium sp.]RGC24857.1 hypothetical protein DWX41_20830 [Hungatella hathewayi]